MKITYAGAPADLEITPTVKFVPSTQYAIEYVDTSDGSIVGVDRGSDSDIYESKIVFHEKHDTIQSLLDFIDAGRLDATSDRNVFIFYELEEYLFGADVDITQTVDGNDNAVEIVFVDVDRRAQKSFRGFSLSATVRAIDPSFVGSASLPTLRPLIGYKGDKTRTVNSFDTYDGTFEHSDRNNDNGIFEAKYMFSTTDIRGLRRSIATTRNGNHSISALSGVTKPFGAGDDSFPLSAKIIDYKETGLVGVDWWGCNFKLVQAR